MRIFPPSRDIPTERPALAPHAMPIRDARPVAPGLRRDGHGFELHARRCGFTDFLDDAAVRARY